MKFRPEVQGFSMSFRLYHLDGLRKAIGLIRALEVLVRRMLRRRSVVKAALRGSRDTIEIDPLDSDLFVASQIFGHREYALDGHVTSRLNALAGDLLRQGRVPVIVDGGANVGYSALFFADTFPEALVVALEPNREAIDAIRRNTARHPRVRPVHAALWSHAGGIRLQSTEKGSWTGFVGEEGDLAPSLTLHGLFDSNPDWSPLIVKLDIEGAEKTVIEASSDIFSSVPCVMIEPHDSLFPGSACLAPLFKALAARPMDTLLQGENLILLDPAITRR